MRFRAVYRHPMYYYFKDAERLLAEQERIAADEARKLADQAAHEAAMENHAQNDQIHEQAQIARQIADDARIEAEVNAIAEAQKIIDDEHFKNETERMSAEAEAHRLWEEQHDAGLQNYRVSQLKKSQLTNVFC